MAENNTNRTVMMLAGAVVVLLIAFVAVVMLNTGAGATPAAQTPGATAGGATATDTTPSLTPSTNFDPKTATKLPSGTTPKAFVASYYQAILDKKWDAAFKLQPAASQAGTVADFKSTQEMYGMSAFTIFSDNTGASEATVIVRQDLGKNGIWNASWSFVKTDGTWLVKGRKVGMGEPTK